MKFSVIIPTLNEEKLLPVILNQLKDPNIQNKYEIEIIVSDGGSTDSTIEIAMRSADVVTVHTDSIPQTIAEGRNCGANTASGNIFIFVNGDIRIKDVHKFFDFIESRFVKSSFDAMTCIVSIFPEEEILSDKIFQFVFNTYFHLLNILGVGMGRGECQIVKREVFERVGGYNKKMAAGEDFDLYKRIKKNGNILFTRKLTVYESPRRYCKIGYLAVTWSWIENAVSVILKNKSIANEWEQVR